MRDYCSDSDSDSDDHGDEDDDECLFDLRDTKLKYLLDAIVTVGPASENKSLYHSAAITHSCRPPNIVLGSNAIRSVDREMHGVLDVASLNFRTASPHIFALRMFTVSSVV